MCKLEFGLGFRSGLYPAGISKERKNGRWRDKEEEGWPLSIGDQWEFQVVILFHFILSYTHIIRICLLWDLTTINPHLRLVAYCVACLCGWWFSGQYLVNIGLRHSSNHTQSKEIELNHNLSHRRNREHRQNHEPRVSHMSSHFYLSIIVFLFIFILRVP